MHNNEKKISDYIDSLNEEKKPKEHGSTDVTPEMEELFETVRLVKSLKEPDIPRDDFPEKIADTLKKRLSREKGFRNKKRNWFFGAASVAAAVALVFLLNMFLPFGKTNMVYAMEKAFKQIRAYHGFLEIVETNAEGKSDALVKLEVWSDKEGHYYVKELEGPQKGLITVNDGQKKWQIQPGKKQINVFPAFPDPYSFTFELGKEIDNVKNALKTRIIGDDTAAGRAAVVIEVTPQGGSPYKIWIDKETKMPLQKQFAMQYSLQYKVSYTSIDFSDAIPKELISYSIPEGFKEINSNPEQLLSNLEEAQRIVGFTPKVPENIPAEYTQNNIAVENNIKVVKISYASQDNKKKVIILQGKANGEFKPASMAALGKINGSVAEIQSPIQDGSGILQGGMPYAGATDLSSVRWQQNGFEYAVIGSTSIEELAPFIKGLTNSTVDLTSFEDQSLNKPRIQVPVNLKAEEGDQKNADSGHSPWKLDPVFVAQVFVSLKISPQGIQGDYPIKTEEMKVIQNTGKEAVIEVSGNKAPVKRVYLKRLIRQDPTGIWTVVGYDPADTK